MGKQDGAIVEVGYESRRYERVPKPALSSSWRNIITPKRHKNVMKTCSKTADCSRRDASQEVEEEVLKLITETFCFCFICYNPRKREEIRHCTFSATAWSSGRERSQIRPDDGRAEVVRCSLSADRTTHTILPIRSHRRRFRCSHAVSCSPGRRRQQRAAEHGAHRCAGGVGELRTCRSWSGAAAFRWCAPAARPSSCAAAWARRWVTRQRRWRGDRTARMRSSCGGRSRWPSSPSRLTGRVCPSDCVGRKKVCYCCVMICKCFDLILSESFDGMGRYVFVNQLEWGLCHVLFVLMYLLWTMAMLYDHKLQR